MLKRWLFVMVKAPVAGRVKTRLGRGIGVGRATSVYRHTTAAVIARVSRPGAWTTVLAVAPDPAIGTPMLTLGTARRAQGPGDLGQRLHRVLEQCPPGPVCIIGSDVPQINAGHISRAFAALGRSDVVLGPSPDGGYWIVGLKRRPRVLRLFDGVRWSTPHALADTRARAGQARVATLETLQDLDDAQDFVQLGALAGRRIPPALPQDLICDVPAGAA